MLNSKKISIYIHIPFCKAKCSYCDFNSVAGKDSLIDSYIVSLIEEIKLYAEKYGSREIKTVFFGGGTPSHLPAECISEVTKALNFHYNIEKDIEFSIEANPGTLTKSKLEEYRSAGINRLSMGLQSCNENELMILNRIHNMNDLEKNFKDARDEGFENINIDIMFGIPGQTMDSFENTLLNVIRLNPEHISCYSLKLEEGTGLFGSVRDGTLDEIDDEFDREMYHMAVSEFKKAGYNHYEISNFAKPGFESVHNMVYWTGIEYLGLGAGAHSYIDGMRFENVKSIEKYIEILNRYEKPVIESTILNKEEMISEYMFLGLRLIEGINVDDFFRKFNRNIYDVYDNKINMLIDRKLLIKTGNKIRLTNLGLDLANKVFMEFI